MGPRTHIHLTRARLPSNLRSSTTQALVILALSGANLQSWIQALRTSRVQATKGSAFSPQCKATQVVTHLPDRQRPVALAKSVRALSICWGLTPVEAA
eukprot:2153579-Alexandrium_andersonii.AAC.1